MKNNNFGTGLNPFEIPPISSAWSCDYNILPKVTPSVFKDYTSKRGEWLWPTTESIRNVDKKEGCLRKILFSALWNFICESTNQKNRLAIKFVLPPSYFKFQSFLKHTVTAQLVSVGYVAIPLPGFFP